MAPGNISPQNLGKFVRMADPLALPKTFKDMGEELEKDAQQLSPNALVDKVHAWADKLRTAADQTKEGVLYGDDAKSVVPHLAIQTIKDGGYVQTVSQQISSTEPAGEIGTINLLDVADVAQDQTKAEDTIVLFARLYASGQLQDPFHASRVRLVGRTSGVEVENMFEIPLSDCFPADGDTGLLPVWHEIQTGEGDQFAIDVNVVEQMTMGDDEELRAEFWTIDSQFVKES